MILNWKLFYEAKMIDNEVQDFLIGISVSRGGISLFDPKIAGLVRFATQISFKINLKKFREISINFLVGMLL